MSSPITIQGQQDYNSPFNFCARVMLGKDEVEDFFGWAFGESLNNATKLDFVISRWNERRGEMFVVSKDDGELKIFDTIYRIYTQNILKENRIHTSRNNIERKI